ncbi:hypothetical protein Tco_0384632, partial [Tanacetum coccineum]
LRVLHPPSPDYVPGPEYPDYVALSDDEVLVEDQPLPANASPIALSPGYVADSDPEKDPEEDHADGRDEDKEEPSEYDADERRRRLQTTTRRRSIQLRPTLHHPDHLISVFHLLGLVFVEHGRLSDLILPHHHLLRYVLPGLW